MAATERRTSAPVRSFKRARVSRPPAHWERTPAGNRPDIPLLQHWQKASTEPLSYAKYNVEPDVPAFDDDTYNSHLTDPNWTIKETRKLIDTYKEANGKWIVVVDRYDIPGRSMEDLKARFYKVSAALLQLATPTSSMTSSEWQLYETLVNFNPQQEASRKRLADGHLHRKKDEVDEEAVLLAELQRIMANQSALEESREELRRRLDYPKAGTNSYQYSTSQNLGSLWQQLISADKWRKNQRLRFGPTSGSTAGEGAGPTPVSARPRESNASIQQSEPSPANTTKLSDKDMQRMGVTQVSAGDKLPSGVTFASDKLSKPRVAKSTIQTDKIAAILQHIGVPELIPLPTPAIIESFESLMGKVHTLLDMRKVAEKEDQELRVREAEAAQE